MGDSINLTKKNGFIQSIKNVKTRVFGENVSQFFINNIMKMILAASGSTVFLLGEPIGALILRKLLHNLLTSIHPRLPLYIFLVILACIVIIPTVKKCKELIAELKEGVRKNEGKINLSTTLDIVREILGKEVMAFKENIKKAIQCVKNVKENVKISLGSLFTIIQLFFSNSLSKKNKS